MYKLFSKSPEKVFKLIKTYAYIVLGLCFFAVIQAVLYLKWEIIVGALWNVPGNFRRLGSTFWDVNHFGALLGGLLPIIGVLILVSDKLKEKLIHFLMFVPMLGVLILTNSRTALLVAFISFVSFVMVFLYKKFGVKGIVALVVVIFLFSGGYDE